MLYTSIFESYKIISTPARYPPTPVWKIKTVLQYYVLDGPLDLRFKILFVLKIYSSYSLYFGFILILGIKEAIK